jgi:protein gp37
MAEFSAFVGAGCWPSNLWVGTSVTEPKYLRRIDNLITVGDGSTTRFLSLEPQYAPISLAGKLEGIRWLIQGGESGPTKPGKLTEEQFAQRRARPFDLAWARQIRDECAGAKVKYFLKQVGSIPVEYGRSVELRDGHGGDWSEWPKDLRVREMPKGGCR